MAHKFFFWLWVMLLIIIHSIDMVLTREYIHDNWQKEIFLPMSMLIKYCGIYLALDVSRIFFYSFILVCIYCQKSKHTLYLLGVVNAWYWTAMFFWLVDLGFVKMPPFLNF